MDHISHEPGTVDEAKQRLRSITKRTDLLDIIKQHPLKSAGSAFFAGMLWRKLEKKSLPIALLQIAMLVMRNR